MSFRINSNVPAMTALRHVGNTESNMAGSITRLSTGLRINNAGDDPAGLIISEDMRAQIKGIEQAMRNSQDAVNMSKTAEGALDELQGLLRNLRALAVHAANTAVVDGNQLQADQSQVRSTLQSINRIAEHTSWGAKRILDGSAGTVTNITDTSLVKSLFLGGQVGGETIRSGPVSVARVTQATKTAVTLAKTGGFATSAAVVPTGTFAINGVSFTVQAGRTVSDVVSMINAQMGVTGVEAVITGAGPVSVQLVSTKYGPNFPVRYSETSSILHNGAPTAGALGANGVFTVTAPVEPAPNTVTETFTGGVGPGVDGLELVSSSGNRLVMTENGNNTAGPAVVGAVEAGDLRFQIGPNPNQMVTFAIPRVYAENLGLGIVSGQSLASIDVTTTQGANDAMKIVEGAIQQLAKMRGDLGAFQKNFLESTVRSLSIASENYTASESAIRDADIAYEMTEFTKIQVLRQSGLSVLAQASQMPQGVLQLLGGR